MKSGVRFLAGGLIAALFAALIGGFSQAPRYASFPADHGLLKLSLSPVGRRVGECRERSAEELAGKIPTMRKALDCPRARHPVRLTLVIDGQTVYDATKSPAGLSQDGASRFYATFPLTTGHRRLSITMHDGGEPRQWSAVITLTPAQVLVVGLSADGNKFEVR